MLSVLVLLEKELVQESGKSWISINNLATPIEGGRDDSMLTNSMGGVGRNGSGFSTRIYHCGLHKVLRHL